MFSFIDQAQVYTIDEKENDKTRRIKISANIAGLEMFAGLEMLLLNSQELDCQLRGCYPFGRNGVV